MKTIYAYIDQPTDNLVSGRLVALSVGENVIERTIDAGTLQRRNNSPSLSKGNVIATPALVVRDLSLTNVGFISQCLLRQPCLQAVLFETHRQIPNSRTHKLLPRYSASQYLSSLFVQYSSIRLAR